MEQALVFASIVLGVAVANELNNLHKLLQSDKVKWHWAQCLFALLTLLTIMAFWWMLAKRDMNIEITLGGFLPIMWVMVVFNLLACVALPDRIPDEGLNLADYYQQRRRYLWTLYLLASVPLAVSWVIFSAINATNAAQFASMVGGEIFAVALMVFMFFAQSWWKVALGYTVFGVVVASWLFRTI